MYFQYFGNRENGCPRNVIRGEGGRQSEASTADLKQPVSTSQQKGPCNLHLIGNKEVQLQKRLLGCLTVIAFITPQGSNTMHIL